MVDPDSVTLFPVSAEASRRINELAHNQTGGGGGGGEEMERRLTKIETSIEKIDDRLRGVENNLATLTERVAHLPGKGFIITVVGGGAALIGFSDQISALAQKLFGG